MEKVIFKRPEILGATSFCSGCGHGVVWRIIAQTLEELGLVDKAIASIAVGCTSPAYAFVKISSINNPHGRSPAVATGLKTDDNIVFCYQGDGDMAAIGFSETFQVANRGTNITVIAVNNAIYGMTGGQMAPTTLDGQKTSTGVRGKAHGHQIKMCEVLSQSEGPAFIARVSVDTIGGKVGEIVKAERAIKKAFQYQMEGKGYSFVEVLSGCPTNWKTDAQKTNDFIGEMKQVFPLGVFRDKFAEEGKS